MEVGQLAADLEVNPFKMHLGNLRSIMKTVLVGEQRACMRSDMEKAIAFFSQLAETLKT